MLAATAFAANAASTSFNGAYLGAQAGLVMSKTKSVITHEGTLVNITDNFANQTGALNKSSRGFLFGTYFGYGHNMNGFYIGAEMSILGDTSKRTLNTNFTGSALNTDTLNITTKFKRGLVFGVAPRLGFVFGENLIYVKPGIEISRDKASYSLTETGSHPGTDVGSKSKTNIVFTPAVGYERAFGKMIFRAEYTYNAGKKIAMVSTTTPSTGVVGTTSYKDNRFVIGAAYKF